MILRWCCFVFLIGSLFAAGVEVGQYDDPRDLTLKVHDPFVQDNTDLMQPVVGDYSIRILPGYVNARGAGTNFDCHGLYFKQVGPVIYIDVRDPPRQRKAGAYDLYVSLTVPGQPVSSNRLRRHIVYTDAATDVLLVIDNSRSMKKNDPYGLRYSACENFLNLAALSEKINNIGILRFAGSAREVMDWKNPKAAKKLNIRKMLSRIRPGSFTNINDALELSASYFEDSTAAEKVVVLLTDGKNEPDRYRDTHLLLKELGVRVFTVGLSEQADTKQLRLISSDTGGEFFQAVDDSRLLRIYNRIAQQLSDFKTIMEGEAIEKVEIPLNSYDEFVDINVYGYPKGTLFDILDAKGNKVDFYTILGGKGQDTSLFRLAKPRAGTYEVRMVGQKGAFSYDVNTHSKLFMKMFPLDSKYLRGEVVHIAASLAHRQTPMINADVHAMLRNDKGELLKRLTLYDDGVHGDNHAGDGVYGAILPLEMPEGHVNVELVARGNTPYGEEFFRTQNDSFYVLDGGVEKGDYFLASVLPLYIDLGGIDQGSLAKASLRLSFEGRGSREITIRPGDDLVSKIDEDAFLDWSTVTFPESSTMKPSQAQVVTLNFQIPLGAALGPYSGSVIISLGDQEIMIPVDLIVNQGALVRERPVFEEPESPIAPQTLARVEPEVPTPKMTLPETRGDFRPTEKVVAPEVSWTPPSVTEAIVEAPIQQTKVIEPPPPPLEPIAFEVSPGAVPTFAIAEGQFASLVFSVENRSTHAGNVQLQLDGVGELERSLVELEAGETKEVIWSWDALELELAPREVGLRFFNEGGEQKVALTWQLPETQWPWFLWITCGMLGFIAVVYGIAWLMGHIPSDGWVSLSALGHLVLVILSVLFLLPKEEEVIEEVERETISFELIQPDPVIEEEIPEPEVEMRREEVKEVVEQEFRPERPEMQEAQKEVRELRPLERVTEVKLKESSPNLPEAERRLQQVNMAIENPTVISVNDRPFRRAVMRKVEPKPVVKESSVKPLEEETTLKRTRPNLQPLKATPRDMEMKTVEIEKQKMPELEAPEVQPVDAPKVELQAQTLETEEVLEKVEMREEVNPVSLPEQVVSERAKEELEGPQRADVNIDEPVVSSGNVALRRTTVEQDFAEMQKAQTEVKRQSMDVQASRLEMEDESVQRVEVRQASTSDPEVVERSIEQTYVKTEAFGAQRTEATVGVQTPKEGAEVSLRALEPTEEGAAVATDRVWVPPTETLKPVAKVQAKATVVEVKEEVRARLEVREEEPDVEEPVVEMRVEAERRVVKQETEKLEGLNLDRGLKETPVGLENKRMLAPRASRLPVQEFNTGKRVRRLPPPSLPIPEPERVEFEPETEP